MINDQSSVICKILAQKFNYDSIMYTFFFFFCHGSHILSVFFYRVCLHIKMYLPLYKDGMTDILCNHKFYFYVLMFANEFQLKVTLCNNNVRCSPLSDWWMQAEASDSYCHNIVGFCRMPRLFCFSSVHCHNKTNWYDKNNHPSSFMYLI